MKQIKVGILLDVMGSNMSTSEQEFDDLSERFTRYLTPVKLTFYRACHAGVMSKGIQPNTKLLLFDYGGMGYGCEDLILSNVKGLFEWCDNNPNSLAIVVSTSTWNRYIQAELDDMGLTSLHNLIMDPMLLDDDETAFIPDWFKQEIF